MSLLGELPLKVSRSVYTRQSPRDEHTKDAETSCSPSRRITYIFHHYACNAQQFGQGFIRNFFEFLQADSLHGLGSVLYKGCKTR